jgi:Na+/proline symporter
VHPAITDSTLFPQAFGLVLSGENELLRGVLLGMLLLGFISTSMSTADSLLMSSVQTIWYDITHAKQIDTLLSSDDKEEEGKVVRRARSLLIPISIMMAVGFYGLDLLYGGDVLLFQPVMYALPLSLFVPVVCALFWPELAAKEGRGMGVFVGITVAILLVVGMFITSLLPGQTDTMKNGLPSLMPVVANGTSLVAFLIAPFVAGSRRLLLQLKLRGRIGRGTRRRGQ